MASAGKEFFRERYAQLGGKLKDTTLRPSLRVNTLRTTAKKLIPRLEKRGVTLEKIPWTKNGYWADSPFSLGSTTEHLLGHYYLQEAAAQLPALVLNPKPTDTVLDCCAAPGGKTTQLAQHMNNQGRVIAYELKPYRLRGLTTNLERCGVTNTTVFEGDAAKAEKLDIPFDKILLDAPCAGNYLTEPRWFEKRDPTGIHRSSRIQKRILSNALTVLKPGGTLVYSTCSLEPEENELNMEWALVNLPVKLEKANLPLGDRGLTTVFGQDLHPDIALCKRFWPHKTQTQGFFIAKLVKT